MIKVASRASAPLGIVFFKIPQGKKEEKKERRRGREKKRKMGLICLRT
jgi:hypothetical protein